MENKHFRDAGCCLIRMRQRQFELWSFSCSLWPQKIFWYQHTSADEDMHVSRKEGAWQKIYKIKMLKMCKCDEFCRFWSDNIVTSGLKGRGSWRPREVMLLISKIWKERTESLVLDECLLSQSSCRHYGNRYCITTTATQVLQEGDLGQNRLKGHVSQLLLS